MRHTSYSSYRASEVEWVGDIPEHWQISRLRRVARLEAGEGITSEEIDDAGDFPVFGGNGVRGFADRYTHEGEFVLIGRQGALCGNVHLARGKFWASEHAVVATPVDAVSAPWLCRVTDAMKLNQYSTAAAQPGLAVDRISALGVPLPPVDEQRAIAMFLERETAKVDALIAKKQQLIERLAEYRTALISRTVTKGLPPDVAAAEGFDPSPRLKPSGVDWLGEVPEHWNLARLGGLGFFFKGGGGTKEDEVDGGLPCIRYGDLYTQHQFWIRQSRSGIAEASTSKYKRLRYGDLLFAGSGETIEEIGKSAVNLIEGPAYCGGDVIGFRASVEVDATFFGYAADCPPAIYQKACMGRGVTVMHIYSSELKHLLLPLPPTKEQKAISAFLDRQMERIAILNARVETAIERLQEYRIALITAAVTGKIDVRDYAPAEMRGSAA